MRNRKQFPLGIISEQLQRYDLLRSVYQIQITAQALQREVLYFIKLLKYWKKSRTEKQLYKQGGVNCCFGFFFYKLSYYGFLKQMEQWNNWEMSGMEKQVAKRWKVEEV